MKKIGVYFCYVAIALIITFFGFVMFWVPEINLVGDNTIEINLNDEYVEAGYEASLFGFNVSSNVKVDGDVDTTKVGEYNVVYNVSNYIGKNSSEVVRKVVVKDNVPPVIKLKGDKSVTIYLNGKYKESGATAIDNIDGDISDKIVTSGKVNTSKEGKYTITYSVTDSAGNKTSITRTVTVKKNIYLIEISISEQKLWFYIGDELYLTSNVVTGQVGKYDSPKGTFRIYSKASDTYLIGPDYKSHVDYWMEFTAGIGLHDADWRSTFGGSIYKNNGSHGCINLPYSTAKTLYNKAPYGTTVRIY